MYVYIDLHALIVNNFEHRVLRIEPINTAVQRWASIRAFPLYRPSRYFEQYAECEKQSKKYSLIFPMDYKKSY